jgi:hypothetical protein
MPVAYIDLPSVLKTDTKKKLVKDVSVSIDHAYMIPDTRVFLREWPAEQAGVDGQLGEARAICNFVGTAWTSCRKKASARAEGQRGDRRRMQPSPRASSPPKRQGGLDTMAALLL